MRVNGFLVILCIAALLAGDARAQDRKQWTYINTRTPGKALPSDRVRGLAVQGGVLYAATVKGIWSYNIPRDSGALLPAHPLPRGLINDIRIIGDSLWIASSGGVGVMHLRTGFTDTVPSIKSGITGEAKCITGFKDEVWIGTASQGAFFYNRASGTWGRLSKNSGLSSDNINAIMVCGDSTWFGTAENGLSLYLARKNAFVHFNRYDGLSSNGVNRILEDRGTVYLCTDYGLSSYNRRKDDFSAKYEKHGLCDNLVISALLDGQYLWTGGMGCLSRVDLATGAAVGLTRADGVPDDFITSMAVYGNLLFMATDGQGIGILNKVRPEAAVSRVEFSGRKARIYGNAFSAAEKISYRVSYYNVLIPSLSFSTGIAMMNTNLRDGLLGTWDLSGVMDGDYVVELNVKTEKDASNTCAFPVGTDTFDPELTLDPLPAYTNNGELNLKGSFSEKNVAGIRLFPGDAAASFDPATLRFSGTVTLKDGPNTVKAVITDRIGRSMEIKRSVHFSKKSIVFDLPGLPAQTNKKVVSVNGRMKSGVPVAALSIFPVPSALFFDTLTLLFRAQLSLPYEGENLFILKAEDVAGNISSQKMTLQLDSKGPEFTLPGLPAYTPDSVITVSGALSEFPVDEMLIMPGSMPVKPDPATGKFSFQRHLRPGRNDFTLSAFDRAGNLGQKQLSVVLDVMKPEIVPPAVPSMVRERYFVLEGKYNEDNLESITAEPGAVRAELSPRDYSFSVRLTLNNGDNLFTLVSRDKAGNTSSLKITVPARIGESDKAVMILRERIASLEREVDSLKRTGLESSSALLVGEMVTLKKEIARLQGENGRITGRLETVRKALSSDGKINPRALAQSLADSAGPVAPGARLIYLTRPGDRLRDIALRFYGDAEKYLDIAHYNRILDFENLKPGTRIVIPVSGEMLVGPEGEPK